MTFEFVGSEQDWDDAMGTTEDEGTTARDIELALGMTFADQFRDSIACDEMERGETVAAQIASMTTFGNTGLMTRDNGLLIRMADGSEFQVTIVQSK